MFWVIIPSLPDHFLYTSSPLVYFENLEWLVQVLTIQTIRCRRERQLPRDRLLQYHPIYEVSLSSRYLSIQAHTQGASRRSHAHGDLCQPRQPAQMGSHHVRPSPNRR